MPSAAAASSRSRRSHRWASSQALAAARRPTTCAWCACSRCRPTARSRCSTRRKRTCSASTASKPTSSRWAAARRSIPRSWAVRPTSVRAACSRSSRPTRHGVPLRIIAPASIYSSDHSDTLLLVGKDSPIKSPRDLNGKMMGADAPNDIYSTADARLARPERRRREIAAAGRAQSDRTVARARCRPHRHGRAQTAVFTLATGDRASFARSGNRSTSSARAFCFPAGSQRSTSSRRTRKSSPATMPRSTRHRNTRTRTRTETIDLVAAFSGQDPGRAGARHPLDHGRNAHAVRRATAARLRREVRLHRRDRSTRPASCADRSALQTIRRAHAAPRRRFITLAALASLGAARQRGTSRPTI